jgi:hypothetical protein
MKKKEMEVYYEQFTLLSTYTIRRNYFAKHFSKTVCQHNHSQSYYNRVKEFISAVGWMLRGTQ